MKKWPFWIPMVGFFYTLVMMVKFGPRAQHPLQGWKFNVTAIMHAVSFTLLFIYFIYGF